MLILFEVSQVCALPVKATMYTEIYKANLKETDHVRDQGVDRSIIFTYLLTPWCRILFEKPMFGYRVLIIRHRTLS